jgi:hypothetical protein
MLKRRDHIAGFWDLVTTVEGEDKIVHGVGWPVDGIQNEPSSVDILFGALEMEIRCV